MAEEVSKLIGAYNRAILNSEFLKNNHIKSW